MPVLDYGCDSLERHQRGDTTAFRDLVDEFRDRLVQFFHRLSFDHDRAEDFAQDVFLRLMRIAPSYRPEGRLAGLVFRIANNLWVDHCRSPRAQSRSLDQPGSAAGAARPNDLADQRPDPSQVAAEQDEQQRVTRAIARLAEHQRSAVELVVLQQLAYAEAAAVLRIPVGTVKSRVHMAMAALRDLLTTPALRHRAPVAARRPPTFGRGRRA